MDKTAPENRPTHWTDRDTLTVPEAADILGLGRSAAYAAVKRGEIPSIKIGGRLVVPARRLAALLGYARPDSESAA